MTDPTVGEGVAVGFDNVLLVMCPVDTITDATALASVVSAICIIILMTYVTITVVGVSYSDGVNSEFGYDCLLN